MKKTTAKTITRVILVIFLLCISLQSVTAYAFPPHSYIEKNATRNNNTKDTYEYFNISSGEATVYAGYVGYPNITTGAQIDIKIQRKVLFAWVDVNNGQPNNTWTDYVTGYQGSVTHSLQLPGRGNYRALITYTVYGSGGSPDVISFTLYDSY